MEAGPLTPKAAAGSIARGLATLPRLATTSRSKGKGKGKGKAQDKDNKDIEDSGKGGIGKECEGFCGAAEGVGEKRGQLLSKEGKRDVEMREMTPLVTVAEVGWEVSDMEVEGEGKPEVVAIVIEKKDKGAKETKVWGLEQHVLCQVGDNELEWLGKDLAWLMPLTPVVLLLDFDERAAGEEWQFQRELEAAREELVVVRAWYAVLGNTSRILA
ncbi:hypothetical protein C0989_009267 [Termitomyces sp. Mn162]|nr:hypothetical protein C0989_009267 [Termitomyces sp. Mn162]